LGKLLYEFGHFGFAEPGSIRSARDAFFPD